jgi:hypothetical protein
MNSGLPTGLGLVGESGLSTVALGLGGIEIDLSHGVLVVLVGRLHGGVIGGRADVLGNALGVHRPFASVGSAGAVPGDPAGRALRFCHVAVRTRAAHANLAPSFAWLGRCHGRNIYLSPTITGTYREGPMGTPVQIDGYGPRIQEAGQYVRDCLTLYKNALTARNKVIVEAIDHGYAGNAAARDAQVKQPHIIRILSQSDPDLDFD